MEGEEERGGGPVHAIGHVKCTEPAKRAGPAKDGKSNY